MIVLCNSRTKDLKVYKKSMNVYKGVKQGNIDTDNN